ncbi:MAG: methylmalonyl-CoA mutase family protein [Bacteroidales bacterium]|jgi:methylmalonyl-CoA mutase|nr:methylmalonyl-CoA mutase family protein [Bacteroidales bacterium]
MADTNLFSEFPPVTTEQWENQITIDLKGADYEKKLVWRTNEGINVRPYYRSEHLNGLGYLNATPGSFPYVRGKRQDANKWAIRQDVGVKENQESTANAKALDAIAKGADEIGFCISQKEQVQEVNLTALLAGICSGAHPVHFYTGINAQPVLDAFLKDAEGKQSGRKGVKGSIFFDPLGRLAFSGNFYGKSEFPVDTLKKLIETVKDADNFKVIGVEASHFQNAGATLVQELAYALSMGSEYLSQLTDAGVKAEEIAKRIQFKFAVGSNYFMEIAKLRAARLLWANLVKAFAPQATDETYMTIHGETADWNITVYDSYVNLLRSTTETMSAAIAGVDSMTVQAFDSAYRRSDAFSDRIARNQQIVLQDEAYFGKIVDPSAGSYYIENLTASIADSAWKLFLEIEDKGGYLAAMKAGFIQAQVEESAAKRRAAIASRKEVLLGTNQYANLKEEMKDQIGDVGCCSRSANSEKIAGPLKFFRLGESFEALRLRTENSKRQPKVFLLTIGNLAMRKARAGFAQNFFSVAGFEITDNNGFETVEEGVAAAVKAKADIIVLCSSDDEYPALAPQAVAAAKNKGILVLAGFPKPIVDELKAAGIEHFIYAGQNVIEALTEYQKLLGL